MLAFSRVQITQCPPLSQTIFSPCCSLNDRRKAAHSFYKIVRLFSLFCHFLARFCLLILLLMSGNVLPNPGPIFPCSDCAGNVTWRGRSKQCCTCSKWVHLKCSLLSSKAKTIGSPPPASAGDNAVTSSSDFSRLYTSTVQFGPLSAIAALLPHLRLQTCYPPSVYFVSFPSAPSPSPHAPGCLSTPSASSDSLRVLQ